MNLYVIDYWVPFPASEYGGLFVMAAEDEEQVKQLCIEHTWEPHMEECDFDALNIELIGTTELYTEPQVIQCMTT